MSWGCRTLGLQGLELRLRVWRVLDLGLSGFWIWGFQGLSAPFLEAKLQEQETVV